MEVLLWFCFINVYMFLFQISRLEQTWVTLRQRHTEGAILYEKKLKPFMKNMNDGRGDLNVCHKNVL